jgi:hypothetical protein
MPRVNDEELIAAIDALNIENDANGRRILACFDDAQFAHLEEEGKVILPEAARTMLLEILHHTFLLAHDQKQIRERERVTTELARHASALAAGLREDDRHLLGRDYLLLQCDSLVYAAEVDALRKAVRRRAKSTYADFLIMQTADIFRAAGGTPTLGGGPFSRFLRAMWDILPGDLRALLASSSDRFVARAQSLRPAIRKAAQELTWRF